MDKGDLGLRNEIVTLPDLCVHGRQWQSCRDSACREIWGIAQEQAKEYAQEEKLAAVAKRVAREREEEEGDLEARKKQTEINQEKRMVAEWECSEKGGGYTTRPGLPYDRITVRAMRQYGALNERQAKIVLRLIELGGKKRSSVWSEIGKDLGCSARTVRREVSRIDEQLSQRKLASRANQSEYPPGSIVIVKTRGERAPQYWLTHQLKFRNWTQSWRELLPNTASTRRLLRDGRPVYRSAQIPVRQSPMNRLFGALIKEFGQEFSEPSSQLPLGSEWPPAEFAKDWAFNVQRAKKILLKKYPGGSWSASQVYSALGKGYVLCRNCRTSILKGFRLGGRLTTRRAKFCDDACKMTWQRKKVRSGRKEAK